MIRLGFHEEVGGGGEIGLFMFELIVALFERGSDIFALPLVFCKTFLF
jgi:hypothetical protein